MTWALHIALWILCCCGVFSCGGGQKKQVEFDTRALTEKEALGIIRQVLAERNYTQLQPVDVVLANNTQFNCDLRVAGHPIAIEYITEQDQRTMGALPLPAEGSRLYVLRGRTISPDPLAPGEMIYVFFIPSQNFVYQFNPTPEVRANITFQDVDARLRRDVADFLSWYEKNIAER